MNNVTLIGRLTRDPELRYISTNQTPVATFTLAVDRPFSKDKQADFIRITVFGKQAENCERYLKQGRRSAVQGRIQTGSYKNKDGATIYTTEVIADRVEFLDWGDKNETSSTAGTSSSFGNNAHNEENTNLPEGFQSLDIEDDDEIPF